MTDNVFVGLAFYVIGAIVVLSALAVVLLPRIIHAALFLVIFFVSIAGIYVLLRAEFVAVAQIVIYAGAITVLVLVAVMLTQGSQSLIANQSNAQAGIAGVVSLATFAALVPALLGFQGGTGPAPSRNLLDCFGGTMPAGGAVVDDIPRCLGRWMLTDYILAFEIASVLLLVAMVGAILIAKER